MDLQNLIDDLRTYRAQLEDAIAAMEELARRQGLRDRGRKRREKGAAGIPTKHARKARPKELPLRFGGRYRKKGTGRSVRRRPLHEIPE
jgi:hypothetical protein